MWSHRGMIHANAAIRSKYNALPADKAGKRSAVLARICRRKQKAFHNILQKRAKVWLQSLHFGHVIGIIEIELCNPELYTYRRIL